MPAPVALEATPERAKGKDETMVSQELQNAQKQLNGHKAPDGLRHIGAIDPAKFTAVPDEVDDTGNGYHARLIANGRVTLDSLDARHPQVKQAILMARRWATRKRSGVTDASLVLCGNNGVGKTHIALAIWWSMVTRVMEPPARPIIGEYGKPSPGFAEQPDGLFCLSNDLMGKMGTERDAETGMTIPARASSTIGYPPMLILDDVGLEQSIPFIGKDEQEAERHARFFKILNHCYGNVSVIVTTNLDWVGLAAHIGKRSADRLQQMAPKLPNGDSFVVDMSEVPSYRRRAGGR